MKITQFGNPVLRQKAKSLSRSEILKPNTVDLISGMQSLLVDKKLGIGLAAPQVGKSVRVFVVELQPTDTRPNLKRKSLVVINPEIVETKGEKKPMWEGCISSGDGEVAFFAQVPRYESVRLKFLDENGAQNEDVFDGFAAHVIQHETDHLNGILFVDMVEDPTTFMTTSEYKKMIKAQKK